MNLVITYLVFASLSYYDPSLCHSAPINCFDPNQWWNMAAGHDARDWYGRALACPEEFDIGSQWRLPAVIGYPSKVWTCLDRGGMIVSSFDDSGKVFVVLDLLVSEPIYALKNVPVLVTNSDFRKLDHAIEDHLRRIVTTSPRRY